jgi:hypothetical protein
MLYRALSVADRGLQKHVWWQDWRGECVAIVASGPSTKKVQLELLQNRIHVLVIKTNIDLCPWAEVVYGCDEPWWRDRKGLPNYRGVKLAYDQKCSKYKGINLIKIEVKKDALLMDEPGTVGCGGNSGFQAFNLAAQFGATGICLIGFDMTIGDKLHWYGRNKWAGANNPTEANYRKWRKTFENAAPTAKSFGIDVVTVASRESALKCFPKIDTIEQVFQRWGL